MRTTVDIDDQTCRDLMHLTSAPSRAKAIKMALAEYLDLKRKKQLLALRGKLDIADNWQELRQLELPEQPNE